MPGCGRIMLRHRIPQGLARFLPGQRPPRPEAITLSRRRAAADFHRTRVRNHRQNHAERSSAKGAPDGPTISVTATRRLPLPAGHRLGHPDRGSAVSKATVSSPGCAARRSSAVIRRPSAIGSTVQDTCAHARLSGAVRAGLQRRADRSDPARRGPIHRPTDPERRACRCRRQTPSSTAARNTTGRVGSIASTSTGRTRPPL